MSKLVRQLALLVVSFVICIGAGFWFHDTQTARLIDAEVQMRSHAHLRADAAEWLQAGGIVPTGPLPELSAVQSLLGHFPPRDCDVVLVDRAWQRVPGSAGDRASDQDRLPATERSVDWRAAPWGEDTDSPALPGTIVSAAGNRTALAWPLRDGGGHAIFYHPFAGADTLSGTVVRTLLPLRLTTLAWTCGLLSIVAYLILSQAHNSQQQQRHQSVSAGTLDSASARQAGASNVGQAADLLAGSAGTAIRARY